MKIIEEKDFEMLSPLFRGIRGKGFIKFIMKLFAYDKINQVYDHSREYSGHDFTTRLLNDLGVNYTIGNAERLRYLPQGAFITISNHPYGGLDGIITIDLMAGIRPDYKFMVNKILAQVKAMQENFISVRPVTNNKTLQSNTNINAIRETLSWIQNGHPVGFFPSGAVSDFCLKDLRIRDRQWQSSILNLIKSVKVPILPIRFFDRNSPLFYFLGLINWKIRLIRMPHEVFNKHEKNTRIGIGNLISVEEQEKLTDLKSFGNYLRRSVYEMPLSESFVPKSFLNLTEIKETENSRLKAIDGSF